MHVYLDTGLITFYKDASRMHQKLKMHVTWTNDFLLPRMLVIQNSCMSKRTTARKIPYSDRGPYFSVLVNMHNSTKENEYSVMLIISYAYANLYMYMCF